MQFDFYIIPPSNFVASQLFVCRLTSKVYQHNYQIVIVTENQTAAQQLNQMLWCFDATSFIPHTINAKSKTQVEVGNTSNHQPDVLINMVLPDETAQTIPSSQLKRILQIVPNDPTLKKRAREYYRYLQTAGYKITTHQIKQ